jgi:hypothetical protein
MVGCGFGDEIRALLYGKKRKIPPAQKTFCEGKAGQLSVVQTLSLVRCETRMRELARPDR